MKQFYIVSLLSICLFAGLKSSGQTSLSFYHLGDATYQNSNLNPAYIPDGRWFIGLPVLSGVHVHANNKFSYNQLISKDVSRESIYDEEFTFRSQSRNNS